MAATDNARAGGRAALAAGLRAAALLAAALLAAAVACRSAEPVEEAPLPFHAVFAPITVEADSPTPVGPAPPADPGAARAAGTVRLDLEAEGFTAALRNGLDGHAFALVSCLPREDRPVPAGYEARRELESRWLREAYGRRGDVLVRARLEYDPAVRDHLNDRFWLNLPLFLLGGPFCYFIEDRTYAVRAKLLVEFFDLSKGPEDLEEAPRILGVPIIAELDGVAFDFIDRAGGSIPSYALSLFLPAGLLATRTESVDRGVDRRTTEALVAQLLRKIRAARGRFQMGSPSPFHLDERRLSARRGADGRVDLEVHVIVPERRRLLEYELVWGDGEDQVEAGEFDVDAGEVEPEGRRVVFRREGLAPDPATNHLHLSLLDSQSEARAYTFRITEPEPEPEPLPEAPHAGLRSP